MEHRHSRMSLPGMAQHLQSTILWSRYSGDTRPLKSNEVGETGRKTAFIQGRRMGLVSATLNLVNVILGSGVLGLPYIAAHTGVGLFMGMLVSVAFVMDYSLQLLIASAVITSQPGMRFSYELLGDQAFGVRGRVAISVLIVMQNCGNVVSYFKVFKDVIGEIMKLITSNELLTNSSFMTSAVGILFVYPVSLSSKIGVLAYVGVLQLAIMVCFAFYVIGETANVEAEERTSSFEWFDPDTKIFLAMPTLCFAFICHTGLLPVFDELQEADDLGRTRRPKKRISVVIHFGIILAVCLYTGVSICGYYMFGKDVDQDLLISFENSRFSPSNHIVRIGFAIAVVLSIPLQTFPIRKAMDSLWDVWCGRYTPMTGLAKDVFSIEDFAHLSAEERADNLGLDLSTLSGPTLEFAEYLVEEPNQYIYPVPEGVDVTALGSALDRYIKWIRYGELMLSCVPKPEAATELMTELCPQPPGGWFPHVIKTTIATSFCLMLALTVPNITTVFGVVGATSGTLLEIILPALIYMKLSLSKANLVDLRKYGSVLNARPGADSEEPTEDHEVPLEELRQTVSPLALFFPKCLFCFGVLAFVSSWGGMIYNWVTGN
eukprot:gene9661-14994_t